MNIDKKLKTNQKMGPAQTLDTTYGLGLCLRQKKIKLK